MLIAPAVGPTLWFYWGIDTEDSTMQSEVIKFLTIGAPSSLDPSYNLHHLPNGGIVAHNTIGKVACSNTVL